MSREELIDQLELSAKDYRENIEFFKDAKMNAHRNIEENYLKACEKAIKNLKDLK